MPFTPIATAAKITVKGDLYGQLVENVWTCLVAADPPLLDLDNIANRVAASYPAIIAPMTTALTINEITVRYLGDIAGPEFTLVPATPITGNSANPGLPGNVALCVSLRTALAGRRFRGRKYFSGLVESSVVGNLVDSGVVAEIVTACQEFIDAMIAEEYPLTIVSYAGLTNVNVVSAVCVDNYVDSQRRRLTGRGR